MEGCFLPRQLVQVSIFNQNAIGHWVFFFFFFSLFVFVFVFVWLSVELEGGASKSKFEGQY